MGHLIWPHSKISVSKLMINPKGSVQGLEEVLLRIYPGSFPVVTSSGRSAIVIALQVIGLGRSDRIGIAPYSGACIFNSVGEIATPIPDDIQTGKQAHLVNHQWGYVHKTNATSTVIEDGVESMVTSSDALFPNNGRMEVLSLSKLLGVPMGGVLFCRTSEDASLAREIRDSKRYMALPQFLLCAFSGGSRSALGLWQRSEGINGILLDILCGDIINRFNNFERIVSERRKRLTFVLSKLKPIVNLSSEERLPVAIPIECGNETALQLINIGFTSGLRHFNVRLDQSSWFLKKVFPLPIHSDIAMSNLEAACRLLSRDPKTENLIE